MQLKVVLKNLQHQYKMQELEARNKMYNKNDNLNSSESTAMIEWETEGATEYIKFLANKNDAKNK